MTTLLSPVPRDIPTRAADRAERFVGRRGTLAAVAAWLDSPPEGNRFFVVTGGPGSGKTALMAWLAGAGPDPRAAKDRALRHRVRDAISAVHFCMAASGGSSFSQNPYEFGRHLARQFGDADPDYARLLLEALHIEVHGDARAGVNYGEVIAVKIGTLNIADPVSLYLQACGPLRALCETDPGRRFVILVDALDEAELAPGATTIGSLVADSIELPPGVRFLVSSRPVEAVMARFPADARWDLLADAPGDAGDLARYVVERCKAGGVPPGHPLVAKVTEASDGNFLYARTVLDHWLPRVGQVSSPEELTMPPALDGAYTEFLQREYGTSSTWEQAARPLLAAVGVAQEPLRSDQLRLVLEATADDVQDRLKLCQPYLDGQRPTGPFELYHQSFRDFLFDPVRNPDHSVDLHDAHAHVARRYVSSYGGGWDVSDAEYGLRWAPTHLGQAATTGVGYLRRQYVSELLALLGDETFHEAHQRRLGDPLSLKRDCETALQRACDGQGDQAVGDVLVALTQVERLRARQFDPTTAFELAEQGELAAAERHIAWFGLERRWDQLARLAIAWLGAGADPAGARDVLERVGAEEVDDPLVSTVATLIRHAWGSGDRPSSPELPKAGVHTVQQILHRMAGTGGSEEVLLYEVENPSALANFASNLVFGTEGMLEGGSAYLGAVDGPHLVGYAEQTPDGDRYVDEYLTLQARNSYAFYRSRSLWALIPSITAHHDLGWIRRFLRRLVESALAPSSTDFGEAIPLASVALDVAAGRADAVAGWQSFVERAVSAADAIRLSDPSRRELQQGGGDRWGRHKRRLCALAEAVASVLGDAQSAWSMVDLAMALPWGFAGFESPACLTLAETAHLVQPGDRASVEAALDKAGTSAHCCQDPAFCARTTSRYNALALRWWRIDQPSPEAFDVRAAIERLAADRHAAEFSAIHVVGERYEGRQAPPVHLPFTERAWRARTLRDLAWLYERPLDRFLLLNRELRVEPDTELAEGTLVNVPDDGVAAQVATFLSVQALTAPGMSRADRARLIQSLIPVAVAVEDRTATSTLVARLVLAARPTAERTRTLLPRTLPDIDRPETAIPDVT